MGGVSGIIGMEGLVAAVEQSADSIVITDTHGGIQYVNPAFTKMTGYSSTEALGENPRVLNSGCQSGEFYKELWKTVRSGQVWHGDLINRRKDGTHYKEEMQISPVRNCDGTITGYIAIKRDVTEQRKADDAHRFLAAIVESSEDAIVATSPSGIVLSWNRGAELLFGFTADEAMGKPASIFVSPGRQELMAGWIEQVAEGHTLSNYEGEFLHRSGRSLPLSVAAFPIRNSSGAVVATTAIMRDMSVKIQADRDRALLACIVQSSEDAIIVTTPQGEIVTWSQGAVELFGYAAIEMVGKNLSTLMAAGRVDDLTFAISQLAGGVGISQSETLCVRNDGSSVYISAKVSPIRNAVGHVIALSAVIRDVSKREDSEKKLRESEERFREVFENSPFGIYVTELDSRIKQVNEAFCQMLGYKAEEMLELSVTELTHLEDLDSTRDRFDRLRRTPSGGESTTKRYVHRNGSIVWVRLNITTLPDSGGRCPLFVVQVEDISERRRSEEVLKESEERFRIMADGCPAAMWVTDTVGHLQFVNLAYRRFFGYRFDEMPLGKRESLILSNEAPEFEKAFKARIVRSIAFQGRG